MNSQISTSKPPAANAIFALVVPSICEKTDFSAHVSPGFGDAMTNRVMETLQRNTVDIIAPE